MLDRRATPLRSLASYAQLIRVLARLRYLGDLRHSAPALLRTRLFGDGKEVIAVLYTGRPDASAAVALGLLVERIEGIDGRRLPLGDHGSIPIPDGLSYVWINRVASSSRLIADTAASRMRPTSAGVEAHRAPSPIVLRFRLDDSRYPRQSPPRCRGDAPDRHPDILELIRRVVNPRLAAGGQGLGPGDLSIDMAPAAMGSLAGGAKQFLLGRPCGFHNEWSTAYNAGVWVQLPIVSDAQQCGLASGQSSHPGIVRLGRGVRQQPCRQHLWSPVAALVVRPSYNEEWPIGFPFSVLHGRKNGNPPVATSSHREGSFMFMILLISCALLSPDQTPPRTNPAPNADLEAYQSMQAKAGRTPPHTSGWLSGASSTA